MNDHQETQTARANRGMQENLDRAWPAITASYGLTGAVLLFSLAGFALDAWRHTAPRYLLAGVVLGVVFGLYLVITSTRGPRPS